MPSIQFCLTNSNRVAEEMDVVHGDHVGYTIRFEVARDGRQLIAQLPRSLFYFSNCRWCLQDKTSDKTVLKFMTDGRVFANDLFSRKSKYFSICPYLSFPTFRNAAEGSNDGPPFREIFSHCP